MSDWHGRLLCVDDDADSVEILTTYMRREGIHVFGVRSIGHALAAIRRECFALYILDLSLPDGDGLDLIRQIREIRSQARFILVSAKAYPQDVAKGLESGALAYFTKPVDYEALAKTIRESFQKRDLRVTKAAS
jgi:DNA-binding response OmpR family regulator